jgi:sirohydrochlorin ferrochelatase
MPVIMLIDNGSLRANAAKGLRQLAKKLGDKTGLKIHPVSFKHSDKISTGELDGIPAQTFRSFMAQQLERGEREFVILPLFFGKSRALTSFVPNEVAILNTKFGEFTLDVADTLYPLPDGESGLVDIIYDHVISTAKPLKNIVLVDHGSPIPQVTAVRQHLAQCVQQKLPEGVLLEQAVMERREGKEYDFNGDLLEDWLTRKAEAGETHAAVILMFFLPGSHAGEGGDIIKICESVMEKFPGFTIYISPLITENSKLVDILAIRLEIALA